MSGECHKHTPDQAIQLSVFPVRSGVESHLPGECRVCPETYVELALHALVCGET